MKISVIIPVYNAEKYLEKCILSVINQTYKDWELILVNDGSSDRSLEICNKFAGKDDRIYVLNQENMGPGEARNKGIEAITGEYVVFIDSDDYIDKDYFRLLVPKAKDNDIVFIDAYQVSTDGKKIYTEKMSKFTQWSKEEIIRGQLTGKIPWAGWRKAVKAELLKKNDIRYTVHTIGEEALYSFRIMHTSKTVSFLYEKPVYYYVNREGSQSKINIDDPWGEIYETLKNYLVSIGLYDKYAPTLNSFNISSTIVSLDRISQKYRGKVRKVKLQLRFDLYMSRVDKKYGIDMLSLVNKAKILIPCLKYHWINPIIFASDIRNKGLGFRKMISNL